MFNANEQAKRKDMLHGDASASPSKRVRRNTKATEVGVNVSISFSVANEAGSDSQTLCKRCASIDLEEISSRFNYLRNKHMVARLGKVTKEWQNSSCSMCKVFLSMRPTPSESDEGFCVMAFPARSTKLIVCSGGPAQMAMLGVVRKKTHIRIMSRGKLSVAGFVSVLRIIRKPVRA
jgi:hypothetical protein